jgi:hypothetical protein
MVSAADGNLLRNASSLNVYSCFDVSSYAFHSITNIGTIYMWVVEFLVLLIWSNAYQVITFRMMLRTPRWKTGNCLSFFQFESRKCLLTLVVVALCVSIAFILPEQKHDRGLYYKNTDIPDDGGMDSIDFAGRLVFTFISASALVTFAPVIYEKIKTYAGRRKLRVVAQIVKQSSETSHYEERISPGDGNCLFHALAAYKSLDQAMQRSGCDDEALHAVVRREIIDHLRACCDVLCVGNSGMLLRDYVQAETKGVSFNR